MPGKLGRKICGEHSASLLVTRTGTSEARTGRRVNGCVLTAVSCPAAGGSGQRAGPATEAVPSGSPVPWGFQAASQALQVCVPYFAARGAGRARLFGVRRS